MGIQIRSKRILLNIPTCAKLTQGVQPRTLPHPDSERIIINKVFQNLTSGDHFYEVENLSDSL